MATVNFIIKGQRKPATIYLRFKHGVGIDFMRNVGYVVPPDDWNKRKGRPFMRNPELKDLNLQLELLAMKVYNSFNEESLDNITSAWLKNVIDDHRGIIQNDKVTDKNLLVNAVQSLIDSCGIRENAKGKLGLSKSRIDSYKNLKRLIEDFQSQTMLRVIDVNMRFRTDWLNWMITEKNYSRSYARKKLDDIKTVCKAASLEGIPVSPQLVHLKAGKFKNESIVYLSVLEIESIRNTSIENITLNNARKWLLLGCALGQRASDLLSLSLSDIKSRNGLDVFELKQQKTGKLITIPLSDEVRDLIEEGFPYRISNQKFNSYIKDVCRIAGLDSLTQGGRHDKRTNRKVSGTYPKFELITSHVCRRSFATNLYGVLPTPLIMQITGHSSEKMLLKYIGKGSLDYAQQIADFYEKQRLRKLRTPTLHVLREAVND